ncbi:MAG: FAD binding domain-containing protein [Chloroflexota bacterium]|nr:FAD binding domain-containing protein [Chloroflexota bacterium]
MWHEYINATSIKEVLQILHEQGDQARIVAGATDLILELERGVRTDIDVLVDVSRIPGLDQIVLDEDNVIHIGPMVTHNHCVGSKLLREQALPLAMACWQIGAPQIRNRGTVAGNLLTASPANDTISPLMALDASLTLRSVTGERVVPLSKIYTGVRKTVLRPDEMLVDISFAAMKKSQRGIFMKLGLRRSQAISLVNVSILLTLGQDTVSEAVITLGAVAPTIIHADEAEAYLQGRKLDDETMAEAAHLAMSASRPIGDIRSSDVYRREMVRVLVSRGLSNILHEREQLTMPIKPILLWGHASPGDSANGSHGSKFSGDEILFIKINGQAYQFENGYDKTLLDLLRDEAGLMGTKEGCAEGECGACTVYLDGIAVMSCLVPAPRAHGAEVTTIEGLGDPDHLHPVQDAFVQAGAVQCGYCTPGFVMTAAKLLEERPHPSREQIRQGIAGNLCRCTGYYKIVDAIEKASRMEANDG